MKKITKLTPKQESLLSVYRNKWIAKGLSTNRINREKAIQNFYVFNKLVLGNKKKPVVVFMDSPLTTWFATIFLYSIVYNSDFFQVRTQVRNQVESQVRSQVGNQVESQVGNQVESQVNNQVWHQVWTQVRNQVKNQVWNQVESQVNNQVWHQVDNQVENQVRNQVENQVWHQVGNQVNNQVWHQVDNQVENQVRNQVGNQVENQVDFVSPHLWGNFESGYFSFYNFCNEVLNIEFKEQKKWDCYLKTTDVSLIYPFEDFVVISEKPIDIKRKNFRLHSEDSSAVLYADGFSVYALNGVRVSKEIVMTPAEELDPKLLIEEQNAEVRREIINKVGISRILQKLKGKKIDSWREYELYRIEDIDIEPVNVLKMICPSTGAFYSLRIPPEITKAREAICWCNNGIDPEKIKVEE